MSHDEQRVRTMAGWVGVEISKSRVRTAGKPGYGLYRVRGSVAHRTPAELAGLVPGAVSADGLAERAPWTAYAFTLDEIGRAVTVAITAGTPTGPAHLALALEDRDQTIVRVATRWTSAYPGRRDLGAGGTAGSVLGDASPRQRQRGANAAFHAEHKVRRDYGLTRRHATKLGRQLNGGRPTEVEGS